MTAAVSAVAAAGTTQRYARGTAIAAVVVAIAWHLANNLPGTLTEWPFYAHPELAGTAWVAIAVITGVGAWHVIGRRSRTRATPRGATGLGEATRPAAATGLSTGGLRDTEDATGATDRPWRGTALAVAGVVVLLAANVAVIVATRPDRTYSPGNWAWPSVGWPMMLLLWRRPLPWLLAALGANAVTTVVTMMATRPVDRVDVSRWILVMYSSGAIQLAVPGAGRFLHRLGMRAVQASVAQEEIVTGRLAAERVHADRQARYLEVGQAVRELLGDLAAQRLDPTDLPARQRCAVEASRLRRLIAEHDDAPSPLLHELSACADVAERRGVEVTLETAGVLPPLPLAVRRALTEAPIHVLASARTRARVTVFASAEPASPPVDQGASEVQLSGDVEVSVVADSDVERAAAAGGEGVRTTWAREGGTVWVRTRWAGR